MKQGKLIINDIICQISFEENPSIYLGEKTNEDGSKSLTGFQKWNPFKFSLISKYGYELISGEYDSIFVVPTNETNVWKLFNCVIDLEKNEIEFQNCVLYQE
jgi:hypothetical protein